LKTNQSALKKPIACESEDGFGLLNLLVPRHLSWWSALK